MSNWIKFPGNPMPVVSHWYMVSNTGHDIDEVRGQYTGYPAGFPQFVGGNLISVSLQECYWKEI